MARIHCRLIRTVTDEAFILLFEEGCIQTPIRLIPIDDWKRMVAATTEIQESSTMHNHALELRQIMSILEDTTNFDKLNEIRAILQEYLT